MGDETPKKNPASREPKNKKLTPRQQRFVANVADGKTYTEAYKIAYNKPATTPAVLSNASVLAHKPHVQESLKETLERRYPEMRDTISTYLDDLLRDPEARHSDKLAAIKLIMEVHGWKAPTKSQHLHAKVDAGKFKLPGT